MKGLPRSLARANALTTPVKKITLAISEVMTFTGATGVVSMATAPISDFPEGNILLLGAVSNLTFTGPTSDNLTNDYQGDYGIGTTPASDATISAGDVDIIGATAIPAATGEVSANVRATNATAAILDNTDGSLEINLNVLLDANEVTDGESVDVTVTGTVDILYAALGDD